MSIKNVNKNVPDIKKTFFEHFLSSKLGGLGGRSPSSKDIKNDQENPETQEMHTACYRNISKKNYEKSI